MHFKEQLPSPKSSAKVSSLGSGWSVVTRIYCRELSYKKQDALGLQYATEQSHVPHTSVLSTMRCDPRLRMYIVN